MRVTASAALLALRMWWLVVAVLVAAGATLGVVAVRDAPYVAVTTMRVDTAGFGEVAQQTIVETARLLVDSNRVYSKVAGDAPTAIEELRQRTTVDIVAASSVLEIAVSAQTAQQAERDLNAMVEAAMTSQRELADEQFTATIRSGRDALASGVLPDPVAEEARRDGIGTAVSERQDNALRLAAQLSRIGAILPAVQTGLGARIAAVIGALGGAFAGLVLALVLGVGRRRIKRLSDVRAVAPGLLPAEPMEYTKGVSTVGSDCSRIDYALAMVLVLPGAEDDLPEVVEAVRSDLSRNGSRPFRLAADEIARAEQYADRRSAPAHNGFAPATNGHAVNGHSPSAAGAVPALGMPQRAVDLAESNADTLLVVGQADDKVLNLVGTRADVVLLVARPYRTTLGHLARVTAALGSGRPPIVVLARPTTAGTGGSSGRATPGEGATARPASRPGVELVRPGVAGPGPAPAPRAERSAPVGGPWDAPTLRLSGPTALSGRVEASASASRTPAGTTAPSVQQPEAVVRRSPAPSARPRPSAPSRPPNGDGHRSTPTADRNATAESAEPNVGTAPADRRGPSGTAPSGAPDGDSRTAPDEAAEAGPATPAEGADDGTERTSEPDESRNGAVSRAGSSVDASSR